MPETALRQKTSSRSKWLRRTRDPRAWWVGAFLAALLLAPIYPSCGGTEAVPTGHESGRSSVATERPSVFSDEAKISAWVWKSQLETNPEQIVCRLVIPRIGLEVDVLEMTQDAVLEKGPGHWPETPVPGQGGHFVVSGHRSTYGSVFLRLDELLPGDSIEVLFPYGVVEYEVTRSLIVGVEDTGVVWSRGVEELSLTTCHPPGSEEYRLVVQAEPVSFTPRE